MRTRDHLLMLADPEHPFVRGDLLFDLRADPGQTANLAGTGLEVENELRELLARWARDRRQRAEAEAVELTDEERQQLHALGYIDH